jgi:hypothetical protein
MYVCLTQTVNRLYELRCYCMFEAASIEISYYETSLYLFETSQLRSINNRFGYHINIGKSRRSLYESSTSNSPMLISIVVPRGIYTVNEITAMRSNLQWFADGNVTISRDQHDNPNSHCLGDGSRRPCVRLNVRKPPAQRRSFVEPVCVFVYRLDWLYEDARRQVQRVDDRQRLKQPVCGVRFVSVAVQYRYRQQVSEQTRNAQNAYDVNVDHDTVEHVRRLVKRRRIVGTRRRRSAACHGDNDVRT